MHEEREFSYKPGGYPDTESSSQSETTLAAEVGVGVLALRTYDSVIFVDLRHHNVSADFYNIGGEVAHGIALRFGIAR